MSDRVALALAACLLLATPGLAGCLAPADEASQPADSPASPQADPTGPRGNASLDVPVLGLATYSSVPSDRVEPYVPGDMEPVPCFSEGDSERVDVVLIATEERYDDLPGDHGSATTRHLTVASCAERPAGMAREDANEPPWVALMSWVEGPAYRAFLSEAGAGRAPGNVSISQTAQGYDVRVSTDDGLVARARFATTGVGIPGGDPFDCEPSEQVGRVIYEPAEGRLAALDWNKTESICAAEATVDWPSDSPIAEVLGPERASNFVIDTRVHEAEYVWRVLEAGPGSP